MKKHILIIFAIILSVFLTASSSWALTLYFTEDLSSDGLGSSPYGEVTLTQSGSNVDFAVTLYDNSNFVITGVDRYDFFFNANDISLTDISFSDTSLKAATGDFGDSGKGFYDYGIVYDGQKNGGAGAMPGPIYFTVSNSIISDFISEEVVALNQKDYIFSADIISGTTNYTGLIAVPNYTIPEPATMLLLGFGLLGLTGFRRKFK